MSSVECLREFVSERLTAAAEEIFRVFKQTVAEYEEEIDRQRRLLEIVWKPEIKLHRIELPQQHVWKEEEVFIDQQLCNQERNSSLDQEDPEPPQIKEEQEELSTSQEEEQLELRQETTYGESDHSENQTLNLSIDETLNYISVKSHKVSQPNTNYHQLTNNSHVAQSQDQKEDRHGGSRSSGNAEPKPKKRLHKSRSHTNNVYNHNLSEIHRNTHTGKNSLKCHFCGKTFDYNSKLNTHMRMHTGEKPYLCKTCGKRFSQTSKLKAHIMRIHTGEKPYSCNTCGKRFSDTAALNVHIRLHTGEKPYSCTTCGKGFRLSTVLKVHVRTHTNERPYPCNTCGKSFCRMSDMKRHVRIHTGERPFICTICGKRYIDMSDLKRHLRVHTS